VTVLEAIQKSTEFLAKKGVDSPRLQTELLLAHLLQMPRMKLYLNFDKTLTAAETDQLRDFVKRRSLREPLQHIIGSTSFCGLEMKVNRQVLVPRPETELLAECGWTFLGGRGDLATALDFGTGSGCLAITIAVKCPAAQVTAVDISAEALAMALANAEHHQMAGRIQFRAGDGLKVVPEETSFDLIISNPPYIATAEIPTLQPEVRDFDPALALDGGPDGLRFYEMLAREAGGRLRPGGKIMMEFGDGQADAIRKLFADEKWIVEAVKDDYSHRARILIAGRT
jgi:release factor glutamine methyltransferase